MKLLAKYELERFTQGGSALERIAIGFERGRGGGVVVIFPGMEAVDSAALFGRSARTGAAGA